MYAALHTHSYYSLLDGVPSPEQLAWRAAWLDIPVLALTDHNAVYGAIPFPACHVNRWALTKAICTGCLLLRVGEGLLS